MVSLRFQAVDLSAIIVNYNVKHFLEQCLHSVFNAATGIQLEVFVVDNNSVDGSVGLLKEKFPQIQLIENKKNLGFSKANNQAIRISKGKYVLLLNPDTVVQEDTFQKVIAFMDSHPDAGGLGVKMLDGKGNFLPESKRGLPTPSVAFCKIFGLSKLFPKSKKFGRYHLGFLDKDNIHEIDVLSGAFMLLRKEALDKAGLLDEAFFMYGEDIDLSYRVQLAGYKNYYFPETKIIHYKGESTKKTSVNYVFVFYKAMIIFAAKHFTQKNAKLFSLLIHLAIYIRAGMAILNRFIRWAVLPFTDAAILLGLLFFITRLYEKEFIGPVGGSFDNNLVSIALSSYLFVWQFSVFLSGGYDYPFKFLKLFRGVIVGTALILIAYSLLPEAFRFSRAVILLGSSVVFAWYTLSRLIFKFLGWKKFKSAKEITTKILIIGEQEEFFRVRQILQATGKNTSDLLFLSVVESENRIDEQVGYADQLEEVIKIYSVDEVIFCARNVSSSTIIESMLKLVASGIDFKIAPPESLSIIGSNSIDTAGDLYVIDVNSINKPENKRKKRTFDFILAIFFLLASPVLLFFQDTKKYFFVNLINVLLGKWTWVGYGNFSNPALPKIKTSVLSMPDSLEGSILKNSETIQRLNLNYAKDYKIENDFRLIWKCLRIIGRKVM